MGRSSESQMSCVHRWKWEWSENTSNGLVRKTSRVTQTLYDWSRNLPRNEYRMSHWNISLLRSRFWGFCKHLYGERCETSPPKHGCGNRLMEEDWLSGTSPGGSFSCNDPKCFRELWLVANEISSCFRSLFEHCRGITIIEYIIDFSLVN